jgi:hypothetical protein
LISEQGQAHQGVTLGAETTRLLSELGTVETKVASLMKGSPGEMHKEEDLLHQAAQDALVAGEAKVRAKGKREHLLSLIKKAQTLTQVKSNSTQRLGAEAAMLSYGERIAKVASNDRRIFSEVQMVEQKVQAALKGKNASVSAKVTKLLDMAEDKIKEVASSEDHVAQEARTAAQKIHAFQQLKSSSTAQMLSRAHAKAVTSRAERNAMRQRAVSQALAEEGKYAAGESALAKDGQRVFSEMAQLKGMVAQAFAHTDSKGVEKAMKVGELLGKAQDDQRQASELDAKQAKDTRADMERLSAMVPAPVPSAKVAKAAIHAPKFPLALANMSVVKDQQHLLKETLLAERAINASLNESNNVSVQKEVLRLMEKARLSEQNILALEAKA